jgi:ring-1,2-phenylacetyl-CoA epoxidase subunit PaaC
MGAPGDASVTTEARFRYVLRLADASLVLAQRLGELIGHAPALEEDLGLANIGLDLLGQSRLLLAYASELEGRGRGEDELAFLRDPAQFLNPTLVEQPNGDFAQTIARQFLFDAWQLGVHEQLTASTDARIAEIASKAIKETRYHLRYSSHWLIRLGDGTEESHRRAQTALEILWPYVTELSTPDDLDAQMLGAGIGPDLHAVQSSWNSIVNDVLVEATLQRPRDRPFRWFGKQGNHSEHLGRVLAEMQYMQRTYPGAQW